MTKDAVSKWVIRRYDGSEVETTEDWVAKEVPMTIMVNGVEFATLVCSPDHQKELAVGFLASEGAIRTPGEIEKMTFNETQGFIYVNLNRPLPDTSQPSKRVIGSCCGKSRQFYFQSDVQTARTITKSSKIKSSDCYRLMAELQNESQDFFLTGGIHNAALCHKGRLAAVRSDIGRHNALDKLYGYLFNQRLPQRELAIVFSGRISSEVLLKSAKMGIGILLSKSPPTDLALKLAEDLNITTAGFIRGQKMNVYTRPNRIV